MTASSAAAKISRFLSPPRDAYSPHCPPCPRAQQWREWAQRNNPSTGTSHLRATAPTGAAGLARTRSATTACTCGAGGSA